MLPLDLARPRDARAVGARLAREVRPGATLVHGAGLWPTRCARVDGLEEAYAVNCVGPLALQAPLLEAGAVARVLVVGAGLAALGRFDAARTPTGQDFSRLRTYASTKLAGAIGMRDAARRHPAVDLAVVHPGVARTELGEGAGGLLGWLVRLAKRRMGAPEVCAERLARLLEAPRWQTSPGEAPWYFEDQRKPWPAAFDRDEAAVLAALARDLA